MSTSENVVRVDALSFSFNVSYMRDLSQWHEFKSVSGYNGVLPEFPNAPSQIDFRTGLALSADDYQRQLDDYLHEHYSAVYQRIFLFFDRIFGLSVGPVRSRGMQGYSHSCRLFSSDGKHECGWLMFGGIAQKNTAHVQLSGVGCRHLFMHTTPYLLWNTLRGLGVTRLSRVDLCFDDFTGNFSTDYALTAYDDRAFLTGAGGCIQQLDIRRPRAGDRLKGDTIYVGARKSRIYWRIYDKALEQNLDGVSWFRSEVELKKVTVDVLSNVDAYFVGICDYSASVISKHIEHVQKLSADERRVQENLLPCLELLGRVKRVRRQFAKIAGDVLDIFDGDTGAAFGLLACSDAVEKYSLGEYESSLKKGGVIFSHSMKHQRLYGVH
ncbi:replication initiation factor domain-containing protein [Salmonella enterica]|nr:replication initiation factor domain-containing protein [Salmonella enterica]EHW7940161.1 replication initiation factor domain-containing protein [Salmonella enterica]EJC4644047.1 replication initiation factor domain-containing protein [Salmonella enterica]EKQ9925256.1 replication initiation factor domain-containing protein [Salmonella enterica subsp. enterica serovar Panama]ELR8230173.1 replication initiation factor domain-containing protein [Salmonella enterica]